MLARDDDRRPHRRRPGTHASKPPPSRLSPAPCDNRRPGRARPPRRSLSRSLPSIMRRVRRRQEKVAAPNEQRHSPVDLVTCMTA